MNIELTIIFFDHTEREIKNLIAKQKKTVENI